jgi:hypothetical protein
MKSIRVFFAIVLTLLICTSRSEAYYTTRGQNIIDRKTGETVILRGFGIGGWLLPEGYMWGIRKLDRPRQFEEAIADLIGEEDAAEFWKIYHANFLIESDIRAMKSWGVNSIRIALLASVLQPRDEQPANPPYRYSAEGFALLDSLVAWCEQAGMGIIWDMHGAPGAQNAENIADSDGEARLWTERETYWPRCNELWYKIAERYRDRDCIIGYDLLNEPLLRRYPHISEILLRELYMELTRTIRGIDREGIIFVEGDDWAQNFDMLEPLDWDPHLVIAFHSYPPTANHQALERWDRLRKKYNIPLWHGETGEQGPPYHYNTRATAFLESQNVGWSWWTHKKFEQQSQLWNIPRTDGFNRILQYWNGRAERPLKAQAKNWLFDQAQKTHTEACEFLPDMVWSLRGLDPEGYLAARDTVPPEIIRQPADMTVQAGDPAFFYVRAKGYPIQYQWLKNGNHLDDAHEYMIRVDSQNMTEDSCSYSVRVFNLKGSETSRPAALIRLPYSGPVISKTGSAPVIDGLMDPVWKAVPEEELTHVVIGERKSPDDLFVSFRLLWDDLYLYLLAQVQDEQKNDRGETDYDCDGIEIYLDMNNSKSEFYEDDEFMFRSNWNGNQIVNEKNGSLLQAECAQQNLENGYVTEFAIPWAILPGQPESGQFLGFDLHYNDNDGYGRECKLTWHAVLDNAYRTPSAFGTIKLGTPIDE